MEADGLGLQRASGRCCRSGRTSAAPPRPRRSACSSARSGGPGRYSDGESYVNGRTNAELRVDRRRRRDRLEHARARRLLDVRNDVVEVIAGPHREHAGRRGRRRQPCPHPSQARPESTPCTRRRRSGRQPPAPARGRRGRPARPARPRRPPKRPAARSHGSRTARALLRRRRRRRTSPRAPCRRARCCWRAHGRDDRTRGDAAPVDDGVLTRRRGRAVQPTLPSTPGPGRRRVQASQPSRCGFS